MNILIFYKIMQTCDTIDTSIILDINYVQQRYTVIDEIASGDEGKAIRVIDETSHNVYALKVKPYMYDNDFDEIKIGCTLMLLLQYTNCFNIPINWGIINEPIYFNGTYSNLTQWTNLQGVNRFLIFTTELLEDRLDRYQFSFEDSRDIAFELLMTLMALRDIDVRHNDLDERNILIKQTVENRCYKINDETYTVTSKYMPIIIDFGQAERSELHLSYGTDWEVVSRLLQDYMDDSQLNRIDNADETIVLDDFFIDLRNRDVMPGSLVRCFENIEI